MTKRERVPRWTTWTLAALTALLVAVGVAVVSDQAWALVNCASPVAGADADGDGFTDAQECAGITTAGSGTTPVRTTFLRCDGIMPRVNCVDPDSKDLFVIYRPTATGSRLTGLPNPFGTNTFHGITFTGFSTLGVTVHKLTPAQAASDRTVMGPGGSVQKAVRISESLSDGSLTADLGYCQYGTPQGLDGCVVYTRRIRQFIDAKCNLAGDTITNRDQVFLAYATYVILHEGGHTAGGVVAPGLYDPAFGGYHYSPAANFVMSQAAQYSTQANRCTWYIPSVWNLVLDPPAIILK